MIMVSFPFDSKITGYDSDNYPIYDRAVDSSTLSTMINEFVSTGVFPKEQDGFTVAAGDGMTVNVSPGSAIIRGTTCIEKDARTLTIQAADSTYDRIDSVILRNDNNENVRAIDLYVLKGTAASAPVQPALTRDEHIHEIALANIYIPVNATTISDERITDTRADTSRCGWATGVAQDFMESLNNRFAILNNNISNLTKMVENISVKSLDIVVKGTNVNENPQFNGHNRIPAKDAYKITSSTANEYDTKPRLYYCDGYVKIPGITNANKILNMFVTYANGSVTLYKGFLSSFNQYSSEDLKDVTHISFWGHCDNYSGSSDLYVNYLNLTVIYI